MWDASACQCELYVCTIRVQLVWQTGNGRTAVKSKSDTMALIRCLMHVRQKLGRTEFRLIMTVQMEGMLTEALESLYR